MSYVVESLKNQYLAFNYTDSEFLRKRHHNPEQFKDDMIWVAVGFVLWYSYYIILKALPFPRFIINGRPASHEEQIELRNRIVAATHGFSTMVFTLYWHLGNECHCGDTNTPY